MNSTTPSSLLMTRRATEKTLLRPNGSVLTGTTSHQHYRPPHHLPGHDLVIDLNQTGQGKCSAHRQRLGQQPPSTTAVTVPLGIMSRAALGNRTPDLRITRTPSHVDSGL